MLRAVIWQSPVFEMMNYETELLPYIWVNMVYIYTSADTPVN